ncbi:MAG: Type 4 prepilin-like protein leader peptide-processing enzyme [Parcubacteria group bacterium GW2011_GWA2_47_10b]|uniref:Prepilin peptidase n=1 Tax=Candidatus Ryanbacteria bacterium RIFCSPLOWO2_02_FULL_47_14 TaxID=1802129 RepID=A0A1G2H1N0_9BACT|nr:MAG: Type 4 prepilin-like protein leader peptide-processing enzyme [Parcubacteria group bacterium GW2011_GWA2_47_10b]KKU86425.1 MAG: Type 4 prepilin-like protein leader peptide-processing enzyme [Parcubacteria group bacterium GW2011_GWA1_47_9]OGZ47887.1 MAG: hypothetical protein A3C83_03115 [Candidatus Ryanbacteria bacterium RIFCSPHIGHO2_02_FULL_47_25]OGZ56363.1 MAG: hypothetical protein A3J04_03585 [Candidatus Ryanbacteria bacterium RIFCSPLOWO2_02_FULL_47_14]
MPLFLLFLFFLGLAIGSFLNVLVLRINTGESLSGRSRCFSCLAKLQWHDLVPLLSFFAIRGRCRYCGSGISLQYPVVEFLSGVIFVSLGTLAFETFADFFSSFSVTQYIFAVVFFSLLLAIAVYDARHKIIPDQLSIALFACAFLFEIFLMYNQIGAAGKSLQGDIFSAIGAFVFFWGLWFLSRGTWMGLGDAKISFSIGLFLGFPGILVALLAAFWVGAIFGVFMMLAGKYSRRSEVPFAPFLALGAHISFFVISSDAFVVLYNYLGFF